MFLGQQNGDAGAVLGGVGLPFLLAAVADFSTGAITDRGVVCWGRNDLGQTGTGVSSPSGVRAPTRVVGPAGALLGGVQGIDAGGNTTCAVLRGGALKCWGDNMSQQIAPASTSDTSHAIAQSITAVASVHQVAVGGQHVCVLLITDQIRCWGRGDRGQLGMPSAAAASMPPAGVAVPHPVGTVSTVWVAVTAGTMHTCAIDSAGHAYCWGDNSAGQLGQGDTLPRLGPVQVPF